MTARRRPAGFAALPALVLLAVALGTPPAAQAQGTATQAMTGTAVLDLASTVVGLRSLRFGTVTPGVAATVNANAVAGAACTGTCQSGMVTYSNVSKKGTDKFLVVTFPGLPTTLAGPSGTTLPVAFRAAGCLVNQATAAEYYCAAPAAVTSGGNYRMQVNSPSPGGNVANRDANFYIGGTVTPTAGQRPGTYSGTITVAISYSSV